MLRSGRFGPSGGAVVNMRQSTTYEACLGSPGVSGREEEAKSNAHERRSVAHASTVIKSVSESYQ
jgi:hypothetical protein